MNVTVTNVFADDNKGGAVLTQAAIALAHRLDEQVQVSLLLVRGDEAGQSLRHTRSAYPDCTILQPPLAAVVERSGVGAFLVSLALLALGPLAKNLSQPLEYLASADVVISKGGHVFVERHGLRGLLSLWMTAFPLLYGARCGARTIAMGATVGPFVSGGSRRLNRFLLRRLDLVLPREDDSVRHALALGMDGAKVWMVPDGIFGFQHSTDNALARRIVEQYGLSPGRFAVLTTGYPAGDERQFVDRVALSIRRLVGEGLIDQVVIPLHLLRPGHASSDLGLSQALSSALRSVPNQVLDADHSPNELLALYSQAAFVAGRRLHSTLFALLVGTPAIPIVHPLEPAKARGLFKDLGLEDWVVDTADDTGLADVAVRLVENRDEESQRAQAVVYNMRAEWSRSIERIRVALSR